MRKRDRKSFRTGVRDIHADVGADIFIPMTAPMASLDFKMVRFAVWLAALGLLKVKPAVRFSSDAVVWESAQTIDMFGNPATYVTAAGWTNGDGSFQNIFSLTNPRLYVQFGVMVTNTGSVVETAQCELRVDYKDQLAKVVTVGPARVSTDGTTNWVVTPLTDALPTDTVAETRMALEMVSSTGNTTIEAGIEQSNDPLDESQFASNRTEIAAVTRTSDGIYYPTTFPNLTVTKEYMRAVILAKNTSAGSIEACMVYLRFEYR